MAPFKTLMERFNKWRESSFKCLENLSVKIKLWQYKKNKLSCLTYGLNIDWKKNPKVNCDVNSYLNINIFSQLQLKFIFVHSIYHFVLVYKNTKMVMTLLFNFQASLKLCIVCCRRFSEINWFLKTMKELL